MNVMIFLMKIIVIFFFFGGIIKLASVVQRWSVNSFVNAIEVNGNG